MKVGAEMKGHSDQEKKYWGFKWFRIDIALHVFAFDLHFSYLAS